jgi:hypothetical protein
VAEELNGKPTLTARDVSKLEALLDPEPLPCGGVGLVETLANGRPAPRTERWSFGRRSTFAVAWLHLGLGWPEGILRLACPEDLERCVTHRLDDTSSRARPVTNPSNTANPPLDRTSTPPDGHEFSVGRLAADEVLLRGVRWATAAAADGPGDHHRPPQLRSVEPSPLPATPGGGMPPAPPSGGTGGGTGPQPPKGGVGVGDTSVAPGRRGRGTPAGLGRRWARRARTNTSLWGRLWRTSAAVVAVCALVFGVSRCGTLVASVDVSDLPSRVPGGSTASTPPPADTSPTVPAETVPETAPTGSTIGPMFRVCPPSWETTTVPVEGC